MNPLPADLLAALPVGSEPVASAWWASLSDADRGRIAQLWDERLEVCFFTPQEDETGCVDRWEKVPTVKGGRFVPSDDDGRGEWQPGYFEHLLQHPELVLAYEPPAANVSHLHTPRRSPGLPAGGAGAQGLHLSGGIRNLLSVTATWSDTETD